MYSEKVHYKKDVNKFSRVLEVMNLTTKERFFKFWLLVSQLTQPQVTDFVRAKYFTLIRMSDDVERGGECEAAG